MTVSGITVLRSPTFLTIITLAMVLFGISIITLLLVVSGVVQT